MTQIAVKDMDAAKAAISSNSHTYKELCDARDQAKNMASLSKHPTTKKKWEQVATKFNNAATNVRNRFYFYKAKEVLPDLKLDDATMTKITTTATKNNGLANGFAQWVAKIPVLGPMVKNSENNYGALPTLGIPLIIGVGAAHWTNNAVNTALAGGETLTGWLGFFQVAGRTWLLGAAGLVVGITLWAILKKLGAIKSFRQKAEEVIAREEDRDNLIKNYFSENNLTNNQTLLDELKEALQRTPPSWPDQNHPLSDEQYENLKNTITTAMDKTIDTTVDDITKKRTDALIKADQKDSQKVNLISGLSNMNAWYTVKIGSDDVQIKLPTDAEWTRLAPTANEITLADGTKYDSGSKPPFTEYKAAIGGIYKDKGNGKAINTDLIDISKLDTSSITIPKDGIITTTLAQAVLGEPLPQTLTEKNQNDENGDSLSDLGKVRLSGRGIAVFNKLMSNNKLLNSVNKAQKEKDRLDRTLSRV